MEVDHDRMTPVSATAVGSQPEHDYRSRRSASRRLSLQHFEVLLVSLTLLATVTFSWCTYAQTRDHFRIERSSAFVSRFNSAELVGLRELVDRWLESGERAEELFARSKRPAGASTRPDGLTRDDAIATISRLRTLANFFQELGTAIKSETIDETYTHELLGGVCIRYGSTLEPFIVAMRADRQRPTVYDEVFILRARMQALERADRRYLTTSVLLASTFGFIVIAFEAWWACRVALARRRRSADVT